MSNPAKSTPKTEAKFTNLPNSKTSQPTPRAHRFLVRVILNVHGNDFLEHGKKDHDVIGLTNTTDINAMFTEISSYFHDPFKAHGEKNDFCRDCDLTKLVVLWDGEGNGSGERTELTERNCADVMKMVRRRRMRDVLRAVFRDEFDPDVTV